MRFTIHYKSNNQHIVDYVINKVSEQFNNYLRVKKRAIKELSDFVNRISQCKSEVFYVKYQPFDEKRKSVYTIRMRFEVMRNKCNVVVLSMIRLEDRFEDSKSLKVESEMNNMSLYKFDPDLEYRFEQFKNYHRLRNKLPEIKLPQISEIPYIYCWFGHCKVVYKYGSLILADRDTVAICTKTDYVIIDTDTRIYTYAVENLHEYLDREIKGDFGDGLSLLSDPERTVKEIKKYKILNMLG